MNALPDLCQPLNRPLNRPGSSHAVASEPSPLRTSRPPRFSLVPLPDDDAYPQGSYEFPQTSPEKPWDRLAFTFQQEKVVSLEDEDDDYVDDSDPKNCELTSGALGQIIVHTIEILLGHRPPSHLRNWLHPRVFDALARRAGLAIRIRGKAPRCKPPRVLRVQRCHPDERVVEAAIVIHDGQRVRASAMRAEFIRGHWRIVALEIG